MLFKAAVLELPDDFDGGVGSDKQEHRVAALKASWWAHHAWLVNKMGQGDLAVSEYLWVIENSTYARPEDIEMARNNMAAIAEEQYRAEMEKKKQEALKLHNSDFQPH